MLPALHNQLPDLAAATLRLLQKPAARILREAGARVATNTPARDLNALVDRPDDRRIGVTATGWPVWNEAQLAVDTTVVSPRTRDAVPRCNQARWRSGMARLACKKESCFGTELVGATGAQHTLGRPAASWAAGREGSPSHTGSLPLPNARM